VMQQQLGEPALSLKQDVVTRWNSRYDMLQCILDVKNLLMSTIAIMMFRVVFWDILPCKIIVDRRFRGVYCLHHHPSISQKTTLNIILAAVRT
jgi:hypothetical protein